MSDRFAGAGAHAAPFIDETDTVFTFTTGTWGGRGALQKLEEAHRRRGLRGMPMIQLATEKKPNQYGGQNFVPVFSIIQWVDDNTPPTPVPTEKLEFKPAAKPAEKATKPKKSAATASLNDDLPDW
jgi:hypothetical protein